jgi:aspartate/methionine/tyrosine aminotransferase
MALRAKDKVLTRNRTIMLKNLELLDRFFERRRDWFRWIRPESGTIAFVELLLPISIDQLVKDLAEKAGVLIMPASIFDFSGNFFRIGYGRKNMPDALERFEQFLVGYANLH